jgi:hypothetical protein
VKSKFDYKSAYFHLVSLVAIVTIIFAAISGGRGLLRLVFPVLSMDQYTWERVESFEAYKRSSPNPVHAVRPRTGPGMSVDETVAEPVDEGSSDAELRQSWEQERALLVSGQKRRGLWSLIESLVSLVVVIPIYWWHRRAAKRLPGLAVDKENPE